MHIFNKYESHACMIEHIFKNVYGEKPSWAKEKPRRGDFANVALKSYKNPWNLIFPRIFHAYLSLFHFKGRTFCLTVVTGIASWHLNLICRTFAGVVITTTLCFTCYFCRFAWMALLLVIPSFFSRKLSQQVSSVTFAFFPPTWILSLQQESSLLYAQFTTEQSSLVMFVSFRLLLL